MARVFGVSDDGPWEPAEVGENCSSSLKWRAFTLFPMPQLLLSVCCFKLRVPLRVLELRQRLKSHAMRANVETLRHGSASMR
jgi:hypothetical protein